MYQEVGEGALTVQELVVRSGMRLRQFLEDLRCA